MSVKQIVVELYLIIIVQMVFGLFFEKIYTLIIQHPQDSVTEIYRNIEDEILDGCPDLDVHSFKYFISIVKEGIQK